MGRDRFTHSISIMGVDVVVIVEEWESRTSKKPKREVKVKREDEKGVGYIATNKRVASRGLGSFLEPSSRTLPDRSEQIEKTLEMAREELGGANEGLKRDTMVVAESFEELDEKNI